MSQILKTLLIWILAFALPAQTLASAVKLTCGPAHHAALSPAAVLDQYALAHTADRHVHHHDIAYDDVNVHAFAHGDLHENPHASHRMVLDETTDTTNDFKSSFCSACATCSVTASVLPTDAGWSPGRPGSFAPIAYPGLSVSGHIPAGLERPPRPALA